MLPRALFTSPSPEDALVETTAVFLVGNLAAYSFESLRKERERRSELERAQQELKSHLLVIEENQKRLAALNRTSAVISQSLQLTEVLDSAVACVKDVIGVEIVRIYILNEKAGELILAAHYGISEDFATSVNKIPIGEGFNGKVAQSGQPLFVEDALEGSGPTSVPIRNENIRSQLIVPLMSKGIVVGTLCIAMHSYRRFQPEEVDLVMVIGNQIGVAVENAHLFQQEQEISEQLRSSERRFRELFENAHDAIWLCDLEGKVVAANRACANLTGYSMEELLNLKIVNLLSEEGLKTIKNLEQRLLKGENLGSLIEVEIVKNDRTRVVVQLAGSLVFVNKDTIGFQYIARDVTEEKRMQQNQRFLLQQVTRAQEEERKRIAQEIHDETVQALVVLCQEIDNLVSHSKRSPRKTGIHLEHLHERASSIMQGARRLSQDLRPAALDNLGLVPTLEWLASDITSYSGISIDVNVLGTIRRLSDEAELVLFRITQEALRNVSKHAQATSAEVKLEFTNNSTRVTVVDNGIGFIPPQEVSSLPRVGKLGLAGMQERAQLLGGTLTVKSEPTKGTTLTAELPV